MLVTFWSVTNKSGVGVVMTIISDSKRLPGRKGEQNSMWNGGRTVA